VTDPRIELGRCGHVVIHGMTNEVHLDHQDAWEIAWAFFSSPNPGRLAGRMLEIDGQIRDRLSEQAAGAIRAHLAELARTIEEGR
jgi:hypothetical protein